MARRGSPGARGEVAGGAGGTAVMPTAAGGEPIPVTRLTDHVVLIGHGRVGSVVSEALRESSLPFLVIESDPDAAAELRKQSIETITGNAADPEVVRAANLGSACCLLVAIPDAFEGGQAVTQARAANPDSANSQFFIMFQPAPHLDGQYTIFGTVVSGMEFVDAIKKGNPAMNGMVDGPDRMISVRVAGE